MPFCSVRGRKYSLRRNISRPMKKGRSARPAGFREIGDRSHMVTSFSTCDWKEEQKCHWQKVTNLWTGNTVYSNLFWFVRKDSFMISYKNLIFAQWKTLARKYVFFFTFLSQFLSFSKQKRKSGIFQQDSVLVRQQEHNVQAGITDLVGNLWNREGLTDVQSVVRSQSKYFIDLKTNQQTNKQQQQQHHQQ